MRLGPDGFHDRREAGRLLAERLAPLSVPTPVVLALPRGGVPVAYEVARALRAPLDLILVRKIGAPGHEEYAIGAVVDGEPPQVVRNEAVIAALRVPESYIAEETARQVAEIARRRAAYLGPRPPLPVEGRTAIVVDDGIATGATVKAALRGLARARPARLILAVPVAPPEVLAELRPLVDELHCLLAPDPFRAVGLFYDDFSQTADEEVVTLLEQASAHRFGEKAPR
ncbi:Phosphoribosyl transferase domain protein [Rubellimicrobium mesophilum DSM 19309]|uniref:Phosphoribosyl transferase domain protein n=1 Tax=Rubellimicrobium mesophilum DSM 19309 TaxID=442562 RepID=A0A017HT85_9RHOB|nr:phosphoribosyltransferase [Rubellimicrobium mesophilum]EYD77378.1 Phosphoribosyl transferase domain protein [Rubellimicrobium mesophilum DSM 19309]